MTKLNIEEVLVSGTVNTIAIGAGNNVTVTNSGGLFAQQSGNWNVSVINSAGWVVGLGAGGALIGTINTIAIGAGANVTISNSGGLFAQQSGPWTVTIANTGGTTLSQTIANTAGWVVTIANTGGTVLSQTLANTAGWVVTIANTGGTALSQTIANTAGWVVAMSNTGGNVNIANSAGWVFAQSNTAGTFVSTYDTSVVYEALTPTTVKYATVATGNSGNNLIVAAVSGKRIRVLSAFIMSSGSTTFFWQSDSTSATKLTGEAYLVANVGYVLPFHPNGWFQTSTSTLLNLSASAVGSIGGCITYIQVS